MYTLFYPHVLRFLIKIHCFSFPIAKAELQLMKKEATESKAYIEQQQTEERKLLKIIQEADSERLRQKKELDQVISERDILGTQLVRRNDELALLYEKIKIQKSTLDKGQSFKFGEKIVHHLFNKRQKIHMELFFEK